MFPRDEILALEMERANKSAKRRERALIASLLIAIAMLWVLGLSLAVQRYEAYLVDTQEMRGSISYFQQENGQ